MLAFTKGTNALAGCKARLMHGASGTAMVGALHQPGYWVRTDCEHARKNFERLHSDPAALPWLR